VKRPVHQGLPVAVPVPKPKVRKQKKRFAYLRDPARCDFVRAQPCLLSRWGMLPHQCFGTVQVAHVQSRGAGGGDRGNIVPLCLGAHNEQHTAGTRTFEHRWNLDLELAAQHYEACYLREHGSEAD